MSEVNPKAAELFAAGESVNSVGKKLFKNAWSTAKKQYEAWREGGGVVAGDRDKKPKRGRRIASIGEPEVETPEIYDLTVEVPVGRFGDLFDAFTPDEKAYAVQAVLQQRMDGLVGA